MTQLPRKANALHKKSREMPQCTSRYTLAARCTAGLSIPRRPYRLNQRTESEEVGVESVSGDLFDAGGGGKGAVADFLSGMNVGNVDLAGGQSDSRERVVKGETGVGQGAWIDENGVEGAWCRANEVEQFAFVVGLIASDQNAKRLGLLANERFEVGEGSISVDFGFASSQKLHIGTIEDQDADGFLHGRPSRDSGDFPVLQGWSRRPVHSGIPLGHPEAEQ